QKSLLRCFIRSHSLTVKGHQIMPNTRAKARNYSCGECGIGVKYSSILCTGTCNLWYHGGCVNLTERQVTKLTKKEISNWKCRNCNISPPSPTKTLLDSNQVMNNLPILDNPESTTILHIDCAPLSGGEEVFQGTGEEHFQPNIKEKLCCSTPKTQGLTVSSTGLANNSLKEELEHSLTENKSFANDTHTIVEKIQNLVNPEEANLNLSLSLAAEAGSVLLQENTKLKAENNKLLEKCMRLEAELADTSEKTEKMELTEEKYRSKIENLHQELAKLQSQLDKERNNQTKLQEFFEEQDNNQRKLIDNLEKTIFNLEKTIKELTSKSESIKSVIPQATNRDVGTQTCSHTGETLLPLITITELTALKRRQYETECEIQKLKEQVGKTCSQTPNPHKMTSHLSQKNNCSKFNISKKISKNKKKTQFSVALQVAKCKEAATLQGQDSRKQPGRQASETSPLTTPTSPMPGLKITSPSTSSHKISRSPPALAKIRKEGESIEEFFNRHIDEYKDNINIYKDNVKKYGKPSVLCETATSYMPNQSPTQPGPQTQTSSQDATHQLDSFLEKTKIKSTRT
ncbi:hypothetical protein J6590_069166, partial [Homalodisca vitripennis]